MAKERWLIFVLAWGWIVGAASMVQAQSNVFTADGAWCWFSDPRAIWRDGRIHAGWMSADGSVRIGAFSPTDGKMQTTTIAEKFQRDDHDNPALMFLADGRLAAFYAPHASGDMHLRITTKPADISEWTPDRMLSFATPGPRGVTYANPAMLGDEANAIYVFWRGSDFKPTFSVSRDQLQTWTPPRTLIQRPGANTTNRPYVKMWTDSKGRIDLIFTDGHPRNEPTNSVYFVRYEKGGFFKADGTRIGGMDDLPIDPAQCDRVYDGSTAGRAWVWDVCEDSAGNPVLVYTRHPQEIDHRYHYARWDGAKWADVQITPAGKWFPKTPPNTTEREPHYSGGIVLDHQNPGDVYLSRPVNGVFEIEKWTTPDGGKTWTSKAVTSASKTDNVRPFVIRNAPAGSPNLLWMNNIGDYLYWTDYHSEIRINTP